jgi:hypothetical protein
VAGAERGQRAGPHLGDCGRGQHGHRSAGARIEEAEQAELGRKPEPVVLDVVADDLHSCQTERLDVCPEHVEVALERARF